MLLARLQHRSCCCLQAWRLQKELVEAVCKMAPEDGAGAVILLQHLPVYTLGAGSTEGHLRFDPADSPLPLYRTERGGEVGTLFSQPVYAHGLALHE